MRLGPAALVALVLLVTAAPAAASSIVFIRDGDVWLATPTAASSAASPSAVATPRRRWRTTA